MNLLESIRSTFGDSVGELRQAQQALQSNFDALSAQFESVAGERDELRETISELQLTQEDRAWINLDQGFGTLEFDRGQLAEIFRFSRLAFLKNALINRAVELQSDYVFGQEFEIKCDDEAVQKIVNDFWADPANQKEFTSHQAIIMKEQDLAVTGNLFLVEFADRTSGKIVYRSIPVEEIDDIISNPDDRREIWFYKRSWRAAKLDLDTGRTEMEERIAYYPDCDYEPEGFRATVIGGKDVLWDSPVLHVKVGGLSDMRFGIPEIFQALEWARAYVKFMNSVIKLMAAHASLAWDMTVKGGASAVANAKAKWGTSITSEQPLEKNPAPLSGSVGIHTEGTKIQPIKTAGMALSADDGNKILNLICAATGTPYPMLTGDAQLATYATSKTLDRPTELKYLKRQKLWEDAIRKILVRVVNFTQARSPIRLTAPEPSIHINFPPILHHDIGEMTSALVDVATLKGHPDADVIPREDLVRKVLSFFGFENIDDIWKRVKEQIQAKKDEQAALQARQFEQVSAQQPGPQKQQQTTEAALALVGVNGHNS